jgi:hypothetical protein
MYKVFWVTIAFCFLCCNIFGQIDSASLAEAKFMILKKAVWFYSKDTKTFKNAKDCAVAQNVKELEECADKMVGVKDKVVKWDKKFAVKDTSDLRKLVDAILAEFVANSKYVYRDTLREHKVFVSECNAIIGSLKSKISESTPLSTNLAEKTDKGGTPEETPPAIVQHNYTLWVIALMLLSLGGMFYTWVATNRIKQDFKDFKERNNLSGREGNTDISNRLNKMDRQISSFDSSLDTLRDELAKKIARLNIDNQASNYGSIQNTSPVKEASSKPINAVKYAKWADEGDAFSQGALTDEPGGEKIFEITLQSPTLAKFNVTANRNAQLFALTNYDRYLGKTCRFDSIPTTNSVIVNATPGELRLQGNRWQIIFPAEIRFE